LKLLNPKSCYIRYNSQEEKLPNHFRVAVSLSAKFSGFQLN